MIDRSTAATHNEFSPDGMRQFVNSRFFAMNYGVHKHAFSTYCHATHLGDVDVFYEKGFGARWCIRNRHHIAQDPIDVFVISIPMGAQIEMRQGGRSSVCMPGSFVCVSAQRPYFAASAAREHQTFSDYLLKIPGALLRRHLPQIDDYCPQTIQMKSGAGRIFMDIIQSMMREGATLSVLESERCGALLVDALTTAALNAPEFRRPHPEQTATAHARLFRRATAFIERSLSDPDLSPQTIASSCQVSVRYLNLAFASYSTTVGTYIRSSRLQQCQRALRDPRLRDKSILQIANTWGFNDSAHFSRAYKARFHLTPREERNSAVVEAE